MADNFHWVLIFVTFVVDLAVTKFSHPRKLMPMVICKLMSMMMDVATNIVGAPPTLSSISNQRIVAINCHPADSVFDTNILLSHP